MLSHYFGAELHLYSSSKTLGAGVRRQLARHLRLTGAEPMVIPAGGSSPLGVAGYVNAGLELAAQVADGLVPEPDLVYVAAGTTGTSVGLKLGLKLAGLHTRVLPIRVTGKSS